MLKKVVLFFSVFFFIYPIYPKGFPIPLDRVLQVLGIAVLVLQKKDLFRLFASKYFRRFLIVTFILFFVAFLAQLQTQGGRDLYFIGETLDPFFYIFSAYFIYWMFKVCYRQFTIGTLLYYICLAAIFQTLISSVFFLNPNLFNVYLSFLNEGVNRGISIRTGVISKRFMGVGSQFFSGSIKYGIAFFAVLMLPYFPKNRITEKKYKYVICILLITLGGILTGRTVFVAIALGFLMFSIFNAKNILHFIQLNIKLLIGITMAFIAIYFIAMLFLGSDRLHRMVDFVFVLFINFFSGEGLQSHSTNQLMDMYYFPTDMHTWIWGDGRMEYATGGYYMQTDVGISRLLFYFGLPGTLIFFYTMYKYYRIFCKSVHNVYSKIENKASVYIFLFLFLWMVILNLKGLAFESNYFVLFIVFMVLNRIRKSQKAKLV